MKVLELVTLLTLFNGKDDMVKKSIKKKCRTKQLGELSSRLQACALPRGKPGKQTGADRSLKR